MFQASSCFRFGPGRAFFLISVFWTVLGRIGAGFYVFRHGCAVCVAVVLPISVVSSESPES